MKETVINNLVPEERRNIIFTTRFPSDETDYDLKNDSIDSYDKRLDFIQAKIDKLEVIVKKLVDFLLKESEVKL